MIKFAPKIQNIVFEKVEIPFLETFGPKNQNFQFKFKLGTKTNSNMQNSMKNSIYVLFTFFVRNTFFREIFSQIQHCLKEYWISRIIRVFRIEWSCSLFLFSTTNTFFG